MYSKIRKLFDGRSIAFAVLTVLVFGRIVQDAWITTERSSDEAITWDFKAYYVAALAFREGRPEIAYPPGTLSDSPRMPGFTRGLQFTDADSTQPFGRFAIAHGFKGRIGHFVYPLPAIAWIAPFAAFSPRIAATLWYLFSVLLLVATVALASWSAGERSWKSIMGMVVGAYCAFPTVETLRLGQINLVPAALIAGAAFALTRLKPVYAGALVAAAAAVKVTPIVIALAGLARRSVRFSAGVFLGAAAIGTVSLATWGLRANVRYVTEVIPSLGCGTEIAYRNRSLIGALQSTMDILAVGDSDGGELQKEICQASRKGAAIGLLFVVGIVALRRRALGPTDLFTLQIVALLISPLSWRHHYAVIAGPLAYLWAQSKHHSRRGQLTLAFATLLWGAVPVQLLGRLAIGLYQLPLMWSAVVACGIIIVLLNRNTELTNANEISSVSPKR